VNNGTAKKLLARMLGRKFFVVLWRAHTGADLDPALHSHLEYMIELERQGVLFASGPLSGTPGDRLSILRAASVDDARAIAARDPFVTKGLRSFDLREWTLMEGSIGLTLNCSDRSIALA
jgi:uncharacterized protein YciI